ncbi:paired amphipathic helix protein Sin3-like 1 [Vicia villosa]|uniref:paired amphipathic helix protein Sin3-like 1 n=1 Tax=Vicia villosa TaxID=3911 RepID=UPI00273C2EBB|nr:paired amphipathic helix protein Sin3-like 1 [Vicia villosa]
MSSSRSDPMFGHAMVFVAKAKSMLTTEKYSEFLTLLYNYQRARRIDIGVFKQGVFELFKEHKDLISRFNMFLPQGHKFSLPLDDDDDDAFAVEDEKKDVALAVKDDEHQGDGGALTVKKEPKDHDEHQGGGGALTVKEEPKNDEGKKV